MRLRFFFTIFIILSITAASVSAIHFSFFRGERLRLMETNLEQNFTLLTQSDFHLTKKEFSQKGEKLIDDIIGDDKINMIVAIYGDDGKLIYMNDNAEIFDTPQTIGKSFSEWETVEYKDYLIMYLTRQDQGRVMRVGMILNQSIIRWRYLNQRIYIFVGMIILVNMIISFFLTYLLFGPIRLLSDKVNLMAEKIDGGNFNDLQTWFAMVKKSSSKSDEFMGLIDSLDKLASKISETQSLTQRWSALMAHELKAPMTLLRISIDTLIQKTGASQELVQDIEVELKKLEEIIMDFLEWASAENDSTRPELHAVNPYTRLKDQVERFQRVHPGIQFVFEMKPTDDKVFCLPMHFDQVTSNLLSNAVKYGGGKITVKGDSSSISFQDNGQGIPERVMENFGKPFNKYQQKGHPGHGLGLAWVNTLSRKYHWKIDINNQSGTCITLSFPVAE